MIGSAWTPEGWLALAGVVTGAMVGIAGLWFGWRNSKNERATSVKLSAAQHGHELQLARDARLHDVVRVAYEEVLRFVFLLQEVVIATRPFMGPLDPPPDLPESATVRDLFARTATVASEEVMAALKEIQKRFYAFLADVATLDEVLRQGEPGSDTIAYRQKIEEPERALTTRSKSSKA